MDHDDRLLRSDDIAQLKLHLGDEGLHYQDISRAAELLEVCRRWPLLAESEQRLGVEAPAQTGRREPQA
ncbi:MAG: cellulose biosynthesis protein BcsR [Pseudomonas sp.]